VIIWLRKFKQDFHHYKIFGNKNKLFLKFKLSMDIFINNKYVDEILSKLEFELSTYIFFVNVYNSQFYQ